MPNDNAPFDGVEVRDTSKIAALDIGSNSFHLVVARVVAGSVQILHRVKQKVRLAQGLNSDYQLDDEAQQRGLDALNVVAESLQDFPAENVRIVATYTLRKARNAKGFIRAARDILPYPIEVIGGAEEARLIYLGVAHTNHDNGQRLVVDIGGGTTDIAIFTNGAIRHTAVIPIAGDQVTNDIAMALRTPTQNAEDIKIRYACALTQLAKADEVIKVPGVGEKPERELSRQTLAEVVEPRYDELFRLVQAELRRSGFEDLIASGIVLTGGGAKMEGLIELAEEIFHMPVSLGAPRNVAGLKDIVRNPVFATSVGLLQYGLDQEKERPSKRSSRKSSMFARVKSFFTENF